MPEYIEREAAIAEMDVAFPAAPSSEFSKGVAVGLAMAKLAVCHLPAADVRPVKRGRWELDSDPGEPWRYICNICGEKTKDTVMGKPRAHFCPNCGADMKEES